MMFINRMTTGWNVQRVFYLVAGAGMIAISVKDAQWAGILVGGYFASMGLFAFGCASGNCAGGACEQVTRGEQAAEKLK
jgi:hypothetical protein